MVEVLLKHSQRLSLKQTPLGPVLSVRLRAMSMLWGAIKSNERSKKGKDQL